MPYPLIHSDHALLSSVWWKGTSVPGYDSKVWMKDIVGRTMKWSEHGNRDSQHGWEIDHIKPIRVGGSDDLSNLQPLNWQTNCEKGDTYPWP